MRQHNQRLLNDYRTSYASVLTIVAFSLERYLAICHPLLAYTMSGLSRAARIVALIWLVALISALPFAIYTGITYADYPPGSGQLIAESAFCALLDENRPEEWPLYEMATFIFFIIPMGILCLLYLRIGIRIRRTSFVRGRIDVENVARHGTESRQASCRKNVLRMLGTSLLSLITIFAPAAPHSAKDQSRSPASLFRPGSEHLTDTDHFLEFLLFSSKMIGDTPQSPI